MSNILIATVNAAMLHDALQRGSKVAPSKGAAFDKAQGFQLHFERGVLEPSRLNVRATNLEVSFTQVIEAEVFLDGETVIRLPSGLLASFVASLPMDKDQVVRFHWNEKGQVIVQYDKRKTKATFNVITGEYPHIPWYDYEELTDAQELASNIEHISWSTEDSGILQGVRLDGEWMMALSRARAARVKCPIATEEPVVAMLASISQLIKGGTKIKMGTFDGKIVLALDETIQVTSTVLLGAWPNLVGTLEKFDLPHRFKINKTRWIDGINRLLIFVRNDRLPRMTMTIAAGELDMHLSAATTGDVRDSAALTFHEGEESVFYFNPLIILEALTAFPGGTVSVNYGTNKQPIHMKDDDTSYECWLIGFDPGTAVAGDGPGEDTDA